MSLCNFANFQVTIKILLKKGNQVLVLKTHDDMIDFPGGRMDESEVDLSLIDVLRREVEEELGSGIKYRIGQLAFISKRHYSMNGNNFRVLAIYYEAEYLDGLAALSNEHKVAVWMPPADIFKANNIFVSDDEEAQLKAYFIS